MAQAREDIISKHFDEQAEKYKCKYGNHEYDKKRPSGALKHILEKYNIKLSKEVRFIALDAIPSEISS